MIASPTCASGSFAIFAQSRAETARGGAAGGAGAAGCCAFGRAAALGDAGVVVAVREVLSVPLEPAAAMIRMRISATRMPTIQGHFCRFLAGPGGSGGHGCCAVGG